MFKSRMGLTPFTPKIKSISLPDEGSPPMRPEKPLIKPILKNKAQFPSNDSFRRSMTPAPDNIKRKSYLDYEHDSGYHTCVPSTRVRTNSTTSNSSSSNVPLKSILKPSKHESLPSDYPRWSSKGKTKTVDTPAMPRSQKTLTDDERYQPPVYAWPSHFDGKSHHKDEKPHKSASHSTQPSSHSRRSSEDRTKHVLVSEAPLKDEAIALSWPLVAYHHRKRDRFPLLYCDIGFDPRIDLNVRISRGGCSTKMTSAEQYIAVSSHCTVTKMVITCKALERWPVYVERKEGLRCIDVFTAIYDTYRQPLTRREVEKYQEYLDSKFLQAFKMRCKDSPGLPEYNMKMGFLRVDLLMGHRIFQGIQQNGAEWELTLDKPPRR